MLLVKAMARQVHQSATASPVWQRMGHHVTSKCVHILESVQSALRTSNAMYLAREALRAILIVLVVARFWYYSCDIVPLDIQCQTGKSSLALDVRPVHTLYDN